MAKAEDALQACREELELPDVVTDPERLMKAVTALDAAQADVDKLYERWAELESKQAV